MKKLLIIFLLFSFKAIAQKDTIAGVLFYKADGTFITPTSWKKIVFKNDFIRVVKFDSSHVDIPYVPQSAFKPVLKDSTVYVFIPLFTDTSFKSFPTNVHFIITYQNGGATQ